MLDILLVVQIVVGILLIIVVLMQNSSSDGLLGTGGGAGGGVVTAKTAANFFSRATVVLALCFMVNSIVLANLSGKKKNTALPLIEKTKEHKHNLPMAK